MKHENGFTVIEVLIFFAILATLAIFFVLQKNDIDSSYADRDRKAAINMIYYNLTEIYQPAHGYYPDQITIDSLSGVDPTVITDLYGYTIGDPESSYSYEGLDCNSQGECKDFKLTTTLDKEPTYEKSSLD
jgi:type II secretory pathway pseudopilin PulG